VKDAAEVSTVSATVLICPTRRAVPPTRNAPMPVLMVTNRV
jgi:hypothetical protein